MQYYQAVEYINSIPKFATKNSMDHTRRFMELLGNPDNYLRVIHVAGTNGKGSTCAYINQILRHQGEKVGLFTSPHLIEMTERIQINGCDITKAEFEKIFNQVMQAVEILRKEELPHPTFFEFLFGMAMKAFLEHRVTYAILETGLGGRLDATNVVENPCATIITSIGLDHEKYLGETLEEIAQEKAGIIKSNCPTIYDDKVECVNRIIEEQAKKVGAPCKKISDSAYEIIEKTEKNIAFYLKGAYDKNITWKIKNRGSYQVDNASLALMTLMTILPREKQQYNLWGEALLATNWQGRMEEVEKGIIIDGAHNVSAITALAAEVAKLDVLLFSAVADKNYRKMLKILTENIEIDTFIVTTIDDARGVPAKELAELIESYTAKTAYVCEDIAEAWKLLKQKKPQNGRAMCLGSLYLIGMIKEQYRDGK
ncbi:MAG: folylpolyglutamate synthase/dihydrofolate synthase family protein [Eubacteriales bacterium]